MLLPSLMPVGRPAIYTLQELVRAGSPPPPPPQLWQDFLVVAADCSLRSPVGVGEGRGEGQAGRLKQGHKEHLETCVWQMQASRWKRGEGYGQPGGACLAGVLALPASEGGFGDLGVVYFC